jgi:hypothetical protein
MWYPDSQSDVVNVLVIWKIYTDLKFQLDGTNFDK